MKYRDASSFRQALEARLVNEYKENPARLARARRTIASERLLARFAAVSPDKLLLKGGLALELRLGENARATKDVDLSWLTDKEELLDVLLDAAVYDVGDYFRFHIQRDVAPEDRFGGSRRFRVSAELAGRNFDRFLVDIGFSDGSNDEAETLVTKDSLGFAEVPPVEIKAISLERHLAEKVHAYTRVRSRSRQNTRVKDLVDMVLIANYFSVDGGRLEYQMDNTFTGRAAQMLPAELPTPPAVWTTSYANLAIEVGLRSEIRPGFEHASALINPVLTGQVSTAKWDPLTAAWVAK